MLVATDKYYNFGCKMKKKISFSSGNDRMTDSRYLNDKLMNVYYVIIIIINNYYYY